jgi:hypothetical protein
MTNLSSQLPGFRVPDEHVRKALAEDSYNQL